MGGYDGSIKIDSKINSNGFNSGIKSMSSSVKKLGAVLGTAFAIKGISDFVRASVNAASELSNAMTGLESILTGQGKSFKAAQGFIEEYTNDGLLTATEAVTTYKNLSLRGYDDTQIRQVMTALKDSATFGRQASYALGEAVVTASEGLKNENSILVDNAGVTKNVAKMWDEYAKSIGTTANNLTQAQKIQAEVNGILEETKFQTGDSAIYLNTYSGQLSMLQASFTNLKQAVGNGFIPILQAILPYINAVVQGLLTMARTFSAVVQAIFGKSTKSLGKTAKTTDTLGKNANSAATGMNNLGKAAKKAGKEASGAIASFDNLNVLTDTSESGATSGGSTNVSSGTVELEPNIDFSQVEVDVQGILEKLKKYVEPLQNINFDNLINAFNDLKEAIKPFSKTIWSGLEWAYFNILVPLAKWTIEDLLPSFLKLLAAAIKVLNEVIKALKPLGIWLWDNFLEPLAKWTGKAIISALKAVTNALEGIAKWINKNQKLVQAMAITVGLFFLAWKTTELLGFIQMSGGVIKTLQNLGTAIAGVTAKKVIDKAETMYLTALYAKDFLISLAKGTLELGKQAAAWVIATGLRIANTAAINGGTVAAYASAVANEVVTAAQWLWNAALSANPIGLVVIAVAALIAIVTALTIAINQGTKEEQAAAEASKQRATQMEELRKKQQELIEQQDAMAESNLVEVNNSQRLYEELKTLTDEKGNVLEKDKGRVSFILNELNGAMGTEYQLVENQISGYEQLKATIEKQIEQKKVQILLEVEEAKYKQALINVTESQLNKEKAKKEWDEAYAKWKENENVANSERLSAAKKAYDEADVTYKTYNENIRTYETATAEMLKGNNKNAIELLQNRKIELKKYEDTLDLSKDEQNRILQEQYTKSVDDLDDYKEKYLKGVQGFSSDGLTEATNYAIEAEKEYKKVGGNSVQGFIDGTNEKKQDMWTSLRDIFSKGTDKVEEELDINSPSRVYWGIGGNSIQGYIDGANGKKGSLTSAMQNLFNGAVKTAKNILGIHSPSRVFGELGDYSTQGYINNIEDGKKAVNTAIEDTFGGAVDSAESMSQTNLGTNIIDNMISGIESSENRLIKALSEVTQNAIQTVTNQFSYINLFSEFENVRNFKNRLVPQITKTELVPNINYVSKKENNNNLSLDSIMNGFSRILDNKANLGDRPFVLELHIGDSKFGRAVIKSINEAQEAAGKTLIKI